MKKIVGLIILFFAFDATVLADQITLKNGDRLTGKIVKSDGAKLVISTELLGEVAVELAVVTTITSDQSVFITLSDGRTLSGVLSVSGDKAELRPSSGSAVAVERSAITLVRSVDEQNVYERSLHPGVFEQWTGGADVGLALTRGNSNTTNFALGVAMARETLNDKTSLYAASVYNREKTAGFSRTVANTFRFGARYDRNFKPKWFGYGFSDLEHNGLQDLNLRWVIGGGLGYRAIRNERTNLDLLGGLDMNREYFNGTDNDRTSFEAQLGQTLSHRFSSRVTLKEQLYFFPNLSNGGEYRINFDAALVTDISKRIGWQVTLSDHYLSNPPGGFKQNDLVLTTGLKVRLGSLK